MNAATIAKHNVHGWIVGPSNRITRVICISRKSTLPRLNSVAFSQPAVNQKCTIDNMGDAENLISILNEYADFCGETAIFRLSHPRCSAHVQELAPTLLR